MTVITNLTRGVVLADQAAVADTAGRRFLGLMGRAALPAGGALVLPRTRGVHTHFMRFPLDVVFYDRDGVVIEVAHALRPWRFSAYQPRAAGAVELPAGTAAASGTQPGDQLQLPVAPAASTPAGRLTWPRARTAALALLLLYLVAWAYFNLAGTAPLNRFAEPIGGDYIAFHTAGRMLLNGEAAWLYDPDRVRAVQQEETLGLAPTLYVPFRNPPFFAPVYAPLAPFDLVPSYLAWTVLSLGLIAAAVWLVLDTVPSLRKRWRALACIILGFTPLYLGLAGGQNASVSLLLFALIYRALLHGQSGAAGAWAALGLFKPQLFVVFPLIFLVARRWRALALYGLTAGLLGAASLALVGTEGLLGWVRIILSAELEGDITAEHSFRMHSFRAFFHLLLPGQDALALGLSLVASAAVLVPLGVIWAAGRRQAATAAGAVTPTFALQWAFTSVVAVLVSPHLLDYDLSVLIVAALALGPTVPGAVGWIVAFYVVQFLRGSVPVGASEIQLTVPLLLAFCWWLWVRLRPAERHQRVQTAGVPATVGLR